MVIKNFVFLKTVGTAFEDYTEKYVNMMLKNLN